jgi:GAF domain-containing protein/DNA-binding response OmpR family regulator/HAMP domain-containing protein
VLLAALALAFAAGMFLARRMVVPIQALRAGAARLGSGDLGQRIAIKTGDEVEALADQFNDMAGRLQESYANLEQKVEVRTRELSESLEQQTATSEVLRVISSSPGKLQPVFEAMLENATRLCEAPFGTLLLRDGEVLRIAAGHVPPASSTLFEPGSELVVGDNPGHPLVRVLSTKETYHFSDLRTEPSYVGGNPRVVAFVETVGARTALCVPMMKDDECVGAFVTCRQEVRPFTDKQIELVKNFAAQAVIAIENTRLLTELQQSLEQQTATADVLRVISSSPSDLTPVFDAMLANAARLCEAQFGNLLLCEEGAFRVGAQHRIPVAFAEHFQRGTVFHPGPLAPVSRAAATGDFVHIVDLTVDAAYQAGDPPVVAVADLGGARSMLVVPMLKEGSAIGALSIFRQEVRSFSDKQIELVKNFAAQAVIAIENARLLSELRQSLEQQTATSEVLGVISRSKFELQPILQSVVDTAARLCHANAAVIFRLEEDGLYRFAAGYSLEPAYLEIERRTPISPGQETLIGRAALSRQVALIDDAWTDPLYKEKEAAKIGQHHSMMGVPLIRDDVAIGVIGLSRAHVEPFAERDVELVTTFADQAVIAIENVRLFEAEQQRRRELTESLEQQTATSEVLQVISSSPGDLQPVFDTMLENAARLCEAHFGILSLNEDGAFRIGAMHNMPPIFAERFQNEPVIRAGPLAPISRVAATKDFVHVVDLTEDPAYKERDPPIVSLVDVGGVRSILVVPMLKDGELIGTLSIYRREVRPFSNKQIELVKNFAAQAVIAIENTRLLTELRQRTDELGRSVGELRALGEVSQAVNSTLELETVLSTIVTKAVQLSNTEAGAIYVYDERHREFHLRATYGMERELIDALSSRHLGIDETNITMALASREPIQIADLRDEAANDINDLILRAGYRARLAAPLFRGADIVGLLVVRRRTPGAFPQNTVDLIKTFAAQSVLAIQNARLFHEIDEKSRELEVAGQHKSQFLANMSHELRTPLNAIIGYSEILQEEAADAGQNEIVPDLKKIEGAGRHLLGLINDILDLSKVEAGRMEVFLEDVELVPLLEEVRALIAPLAEKNGNVLELKLAEDIGTIHTDRTKLKQSLLNVLSNGSKFTENGRLTLVAERFADNTGRPMVRFAISDTGIGMTEEQLGRLFQAFSQADASTTKKYGGTGLGLAISRQFCQLLGGDITVTSRPGEGSTFTIILPTRSDGPAQIKPADAPRIAAEVNGVATVLIVDDDPAARELLTASLKGTGYRLVHASSGTEALALARTMRPDAITLDIMMPKPDGWDVLTALKADADLYDIPVIIVTMAPDRGIGLSLGAVDVLTKPVDRARLTALIHRLVRRDGPVLVVEDDADTREMMRHTIAKMGLAVAEAANGRRALGWLGEHAPPAMILLDLMMPEMDGFEFLDALSARPEWHEIPIVVVTAKQLSGAERERLLLQARKVIEKAKATRVDIAAAIAAAVRRRSGRVAAVANADK